MGKMYLPQSLINFFYCRKLIDFKKIILGKVYNILLMELFTTKLIGVELHQSKLEANFTIIGSMLSQLKEHVSMLAALHEITEASLNENKQQLETVIKKTNRHHALLLQHQKSIDRFSTLSSPHLLQEQSGEPNLNIPSLRAIASQIAQSEAPRECQRESQVIGKENSNRKEVPKKGQMSINKIIANLAQRVENLERNRRQTEGLIIDQTCQKQSMGVFSSLQKSGAFVSKIDQVKEQSTKFINKQKALIQDEPIASISSQQQDKNIYIGLSGEIKGIVFEKIQGLRKELELQRQAFNQKNRIVDASIRDCQQKLQTFDKGMDLLQRSHEMLKYDFQRTSTSFSKSRTPFSESEGSQARSQGPKQMKICSRDYSEERVVDLFNQMERIRCQYLHIRSQLEKDPLKISQSAHPFSLPSSSLANQSDLRRQVTICKIQLKRLREQFEGLASNSNAGMQVRTVLIKPNENKQDWKNLSTKMHKLRMELQGSVRQLEEKIITSNEMVVEMNQLEVGIEECKLLLKKKVDTADYERSIKKLESRITSFIFQICEKSGKQNQIDAALAKNPWFCLSCDSELKNYTGKLSKNHAVTEKLKGGKVNPEIHMVRRNQNGKLPSVIK